MGRDGKGSKSGLGWKTGHSSSPSVFACPDSGCTSTNPNHTLPQGDSPTQLRSGRGGGSRLSKTASWYFRVRARVGFLGANCLHCLPTDSGKIYLGRQEGCHSARTCCFCAHGVPLHYQRRLPSHEVYPKTGPAGSGPPSVKHQRCAAYPGIPFQEKQGWLGAAAVARVACSPVQEWPNPRNLANPFRAALQEPVTKANAEGVLLRASLFPDVWEMGGRGRHRWCRHVQCGRGAGGGGVLRRALAAAAALPREITQHKASP